MPVNEFIKYFEKYPPKREKYKEKFIQILAYINDIIKTIKKI